MEPPSYEETSLQPPAMSAQGFNIYPPPSYHTSHSSPSTPPPTYGEAVSAPPDLFPVLTPPVAPVAVTSPPQNTDVIMHPVVQIGGMQPVSSRQTPSAVPVVVTQPPPVPIRVTCLTNIPGLVRCSHCQQVVLTKVSHTPSSAAWCMCVLIAVMGLVCGFCLIPLMIRGLQDTHHSCPLCNAHLHTYRR
ncbi:lipopolysaccharide-induced tumor necrosis factor-alpha factor homolog [Anabas testudineus]|uniref:lipopolysaccharide-induced tumor necrosis factor-alpha factor homolog n=1 Tax=Anabas testudineus TaxID=64144 RepID=UPI000E460BEA|nr:lipopolysaccharide-induced tumor necrosis factor-alpha factor homolog [Anabas testudineus]XP_026214596.1 lipopolysaccharide-induced tumor necrosis factor-alpha factor homolog [Anabas testudineus]XP_026214597.1 lipopolysaccharide-induced tumor necrosis factor-alpha factor homolog [Anabas testudineus]